MRQRRPGQSFCKASGHRLAVARASNRLRAGEMKMKKVLCAFWLFIVFPVVADAATAARAYPSGIKETMKICGDLYQTLAPKYQQQLHAQPISMQSLETPVITPIKSSEENKFLNQVSISAGFIDLINHIAHAKAIDRIQPGYFDRYVANLGREPVNGAAQQAPNMVDSRYWADDIMNEQISYFNQMMGMLVAINLSHHYLGHFSKYEKDLAAGKLAPINGFLSPSEWQAAVKAGALNSFDCSCLSDGIKALLEGIGKMATRPQWTLYIVPQTADLKKLAKELTHYEDQYYHGQLH
jgi:hypothetical protein